MVFNPGTEAALMAQVLIARHVINKPTRYVPAFRSMYKKRDLLVDIRILKFFLLFLPGAAKSGRAGISLWRR